MWAFVKRNLLLFFRNRAGVFFSVLGALIAFLLYLVFLKKSMSTLWPLTHPEKLLDPWLIGGTLTITAVTTTQNGLARMIVDRETGRLSDYLLTQASYLRIELGYLISAVIIGTIMQLLMFFTMSGAFLWLDHIAIFWQLTGQIIVLAVFSSLVWTAFNLLILRVPGHHNERHFDDHWNRSWFLCWRLSSHWFCSNCRAKFDEIDAFSLQCRNIPAVTPTATPRVHFFRSPDNGASDL